MFCSFKIILNTKTLGFVSTPSNYPRLRFFFFFVICVDINEGIEESSWQGRRRQLALAMRKSPNLFANF